VALVPDLVFQVASDILECVADALEDAGVEVPERQYVHQGEVALDTCPDCAQLVVSFMGLEHAIPGGDLEIAACAPPRTATFDVWLTRCVPVLHENGDPPTAEELTASAEELNTDAWVLANVIWSTHKADGCWGSTCDSVMLGSLVPYGPEGGCGGSHMTIQLQLTGLGAAVVSS